MSTIEKHDMTQGKILLPLVFFTIPLVLGNLFQLTYNAADSVIVGKYVGEQVPQMSFLPAYPGPDCFSAYFQIRPVPHPAHTGYGFLPAHRIIFYESHK